MPAASTSIRFRSDPTSFHAELRARVAGELARDGTQARGGWAMHVKAAVLLGWLAASYAGLLLAGAHPALAVLLTLSAALAAAGIGFGLMHDASHGSFSASRRVNRAAALTLDLIGGSSYCWRFKHNVLHHTYTNVAGLDADLDAGWFLRLAPSQPWRALHRYQHIYVWFLYGLLPLKWWLVDDFRDVLTGRIGGCQPFPRPGGRDLFLLLAGKAVFFTWAVAVPLLVFRSAWPLAYLAGGSLVLGLVLATVFQLAHCLGEVEFEVAAPGSARRDAGGWAEHQLRTTADFARGNRVLGWYLGGLNLQVEHHLFPQVSHRHYRRLAAVVEATAAAHGLRYRAQPTVLAALRANVRWLRVLGRRPAAPASAALEAS